MGSSAVIYRSRNLLMLIPTDPRPVDTMEIFTHQTPQGASDDPQNPASPHTILRNYFDPAKTTPTQLLYSLEILSSRLIPTGDQEVDEPQVQLFRRNFLESGGLKSVINVLQRNALPSDVDLTVRQDCYAIALALSRCGVQSVKLSLSLTHTHTHTHTHTPLSHSVCVLSRFLLCNQATLLPAQRVSYRQLSSQSSQIADSAGKREEGAGGPRGRGTHGCRGDRGSAQDDEDDQYGR